MPKNLQPKGTTKDEKKPRSETPNIPRMHPLWAFRDVDNEGRWGWDQLDGNNVVEFLKRLKNFETMTWSEIEHGTGSHFVEVGKLHQDAQQRLIELKRDDVAQLFSVRITGERRAWGHRSEHILYFIWYDPKHEVCPSLLRNT